MRRLAGRLATPALSVLLVLGTMAGTPAAVPSADSTDPAVELPRPVRGATAVRLLGDQLDEAAASNNMSAAELTDLLTTDPSAWVDTTGAVFFKEGVAPAPADDPVSAQAPLDQTLQLHSKPGSTKTIFLDFDGGTASATGWHASYPAMPTTQPVWDPSGNGASFTDAELTSIQTIWQAVAEDYAPFDVDVTTADPGPAGIYRSDLLDLAYGSHVMITPSTEAQGAICPSGCGGVAYIGVFGSSNGGAAGDGYGYRQPAWVFPHQLGNSPKNIAEAATHEVGHNFGLSHDGNASEGYDRGHGAWAPIMGVGYDRPITQWSKGDYAEANNQQDDYSVILGVAGARADEAPTTILLAPAAPTGTAYVTSRTDVDTYLLGACSGAVTVAANPSASLANLDVELTVHDVTGDVVTTADPPSTQTTPSTASGMGASVSLT
ncbi:MAG: zinc-dependent metalloprotease family protein, partial [Nocardioides sp.]